MENLSWILWLVLGVTLIVAEIFTLGFFLFWFGVGAIAAALTGLFGFGLLWQFLVFAAVSTLLTAMSRTIFSKYLWGAGSDDLKLGMDALPGKIGTVTIASHGEMHEAAVSLYGSIWTAFPEDGDSVFREGEKVKVVRVSGNTIYVRSAKRQLRGWRQDD
ncbi:MAG: NfeD family protein [Acidobacteria bacterium]|nr:NfeD family protein [Acidobacteriota bacterium]